MKNVIKILMVITVVACSNVKSENSTNMEEHKFKAGKNQVSFKRQISVFELVYFHSCKLKEEIKRMTHCNFVIAIFLCPRYFFFH